MNAWQILGVDTDVGVADLRRRYAALIKEFRPETHPQDFARIREAYEVALPHARRRAAGAAVAPPVDMAEDVAQPPEPTPAAPQAESPRFDDEAAARADAMTPPSGAQDPLEPEPEPESALAAHLRRFQALAGAATGTDDEEFLPALRELLQARTQATLDDSQSLEFALMRWFVEAEKPPLTLLFETGRAFDWHAHVVRLSNWLSPWALRQMEARLALSRDLVYARHFSGNRCLRNLHSPRTGALPIALRPAALEAGHWAERWSHASEDADATSLAGALNPATLKGLHGLASTDVLLGFAVAALAPGAIGATAVGLVTTALVFLARKLLQAVVRRPPEHRLRKILRAVTSHLTAVGVLSAVAAAFGIVLLTAAAPQPVEIAGGVASIAPAVIFATAFGWRVAAYLELVAAWPFLWREAVDRLEFDRFMNGRTAPAEGHLFGQRLGLVERLRAIRPALRFQDKEIAQRARPPRAKPFKLFRFTLGGKPSRGRTLWVGAWLLYAIVRLLISVVGGH